MLVKRSSGQQSSREISRYPGPSVTSSALTTPHRERRRDFLVFVVEVEIRQVVDLQSAIELCVP